MRDGPWGLLIAFMAVVPLVQQNKGNHRAILPKWHEKAEPSWFSFVLTLRDGVPFQRKDLIEWLEDQKIQTRLLFAGNIIHQPAYQTIEKIITGDLKNSDKVMRDTFFVGVYSGLGDREIAYIVEKIKQFLKRY